MPVLEAIVAADVKKPLAARNMDAALPNLIGMTHEEMGEALAEIGVMLAISLHAVRDELRDFWCRLTGNRSKS